MANQQPKVFTCPVMIGRGEELRAIQQWLAPQGPRVLVLSGEAGVGKSRLVAEAKGGATRFGYAILQGNCFEPDHTLPYAPILEVLHGWMAGRSADQVARELGPYAQELVRLLPEQAPALSATTPATAADPETERRRLFQALVQLFHDLAAQHSILLVVEDLQWSDDTTLEFLLYFARRIVSQPILLILTYRSDAMHQALVRFLSELNRERISTDLELSALDITEVDQMLRTIFEQRHPVRAEFLKAVFELTEGNPFFIEEVVKSLVATGDIYYADGIWDRKPLGELRIPLSVQDAVQRRMEQLSRPAQELLALAAVAGRRFDVDLLRQLTPWNERELVSLIKELVGAQLVVEETWNRFAFRHALTRQAIYGHLLARERKMLHKTIAETLAHTSAPELDLRSEELAYHYYQAGTWDQAMRYSERAGEKAQDLYTPGAAIEHFTHAIEAAHQLSLPLPSRWLHSRGHAYETLGEFERARADYESALELAREAEDRHAEGEILLALSLLWAGRDYARAGDYSRRALELAREMKDLPLLAHSLNRVGNWHLNSDQPPQALEYHRQALAIFEELKDSYGIAETLDLLGASCYFSGNLEQGTTYYEQAIALLQELDDRQGLASSLAMLTMRGPTYQTDTMTAPAVSVAQAIQAGERALQTAREIGQRSAESYALIMLAFCLGAQGEYQRALHLAQTALEIAEEIDHRQWTAAAHCALGVLYLDLLEFQQAQEHLVQALSLAKEINSLCWTRRTSGFLASTHILQRDLSSAGIILDAALTFDSPHQSCGQRLAWCARAELALGQGDPALALQIIDDVMAVDAQAVSGSPGMRLSKLRGEALIALGEGHAKEAQAALGVARDVAMAQGARPMLWRIHLALGTLYQTQGNKEAAQDEFVAARCIIEALAAEVPDQQLRKNFLEKALGLLPRPRLLSSRQAAKQSYGGLTSREWEIATLIAQGKTNQDLAEALVLSARTVESHVSNILHKLDFSSRAQIAAWTVGRGITGNTG